MPPVFVDISRFRALFDSARESGHARSHSAGFSADYSADCLAPRAVTVSAEAFARKTFIQPVDDLLVDEVHEEFLLKATPSPFRAPSALSLDYLHAFLKVRCKKCEPCLTARRNMWAARAMTEMGKSTRTWFCTYTLGFHARLELEKLGEGERQSLFTRWHQLYNKSLRKELSKADKPLRFLRVFEHHKDGVLHAHTLVHDLTGFITKRALQKHWRRGFSTVKLAKKQHAFYISKYIGKEMSGRIGSSQFYGEQPPQEVSIHEQWIREITGAI